MRPVLLLSLVACKASLGDGLDASIDTPIAPPVDAVSLGPWATPTPLEITPASDDDPTATGDLLELYFNRSGDIYVTRRASISEAWATPAVAAELSTTVVETTPEVSADGLTMYFASARTPTLGGNDIWVARRAARTDPWGTPQPVTELSSTAADGAATTRDELVILIDSDRDMTMLLDIHMASRASPGAPWGTPAAVGALNSPESEGNAMLAEDGLTVYFDSNRTGNGELFEARRTSVTGTWSTPKIISELSTTFAEVDPWISPDGRTMYFTSTRDGMQRLWQTTR